MRVVVPVLRPPGPGVLVPDDVPGRMEQVIAVRERAYGQGYLFA